MRLDHAARRSQLARAVWTLVLRDGIAAASVRGVAREAGLSMGSVRYLFTSQDDLLRFAMREVIDTARGRIEAGVEARAAMVRQGRPLDAAVALLEQVLPLDDERLVEARVWAVFTAQTLSDPAMAAIRREADDGVRQLCADCLHDLAQLDRLPAGREPDVEIERLRSLLDGMTLHLLFEPAGSPDVEMVRRVLRTHLIDLSGTPIADDEHQQG